MDVTDEYLVVFRLFSYGILGVLRLQSRHTQTIVHNRKTTCTIIYTKSNLFLLNVFIYKKPHTFQKARQFPLRFNVQKAIHLTLRDFHENFEVGIYVQKA